jgi:segregation and condensation protein B
MIEDREKKSALEAFLFLSGDVLTLSTIKDITGLPDAEVRGLMTELTEEYRGKNGGLLIAEIAGGYQMITNPAYAEWVKKFKGSQISTKLSMPALETLAIVAYKQPIIRAEIEQIRGVNSDSAIKTLYEKRLIKIMGRKEAPGRPFFYGTTRELPTLKDLIREEAA